MLATLRQERIMEKLKEENLAYKAKSDESMRRAMSMMMGGQASLVLREAFAGWVHMLSQLQQERMRDELLQLKLKCGESVWEKLGIRVGGQASLVLKSTVTGWREFVATLRQERVMERLKEENLAHKTKRDESMRRAGVDDDGWSGEHGVEECCAGLV